MHAALCARVKILLDVLAHSDLLFIRQPMNDVLDGMHELDKYRPWLQE